MRTITLAFAAAVLGLAVAAAQVPATQKPAAKPTAARPAAKPAAVPRTPDGRPDFQGVWANNTVTPLQRPQQWQGNERLTDAEIADLQKFAAQIVENDGDAQFAGIG